MASARLRRGEALLTWLTHEGASHGVRLGPGPGGLAVFAATDVHAGEALFRCPIARVMRAADTEARAWDGDGEETMLRRRFCAALDRVRVRGRELDQRTRVQLLLLHERRRPGGRWAPYVDALPGEELVGTLPIGWSDEDLERRLRGTALLEETRAARDGLHALADALASVHEDEQKREDDHASEHTGDGVCRDGAGNEVNGDARADFGVFPSSSFGFEDLKWAYAVFWSRALVLELPGSFRGSGGRLGRGTECLVPLLDLCNHRAGATAELRVRGGHFELLAGCSMKRGAEVLINYGAKGNGELLRCHGFVVPHNPADVCPLPLTQLIPPKGVTQSQLRERLALAEQLQLPLRVFLFDVAGGGKADTLLPDTLLPTARLLCAVTEEDERIARAAVDPDVKRDETSKAGEQETPGFDWSKVDWDAEDPFAGCGGDESSQREGLSVEGERAMLDALDAFIAGLVDAIPIAATAADVAAVEDRSGAADDAVVQGSMSADASEIERRLKDGLASSSHSGGFESAPGDGSANLAGLVYRRSQSKLLRGVQAVIQRLRDGGGRVCVNVAGVEATTGGVTRKRGREQT